MMKNEGEDEDEDEALMISNKVALESIQNLHDYLQQNSDIKVDSSFIAGLRDLKWKLIKRERILQRKMLLTVQYSRVPEWKNHVYYDNLRKL